MSLNTRIDAISSVGEIRIDRPALARHQLFVSVGAVAAVLIVAMALIGSRGQTSGNDQVASNAGKAFSIVHTTVRETPSNAMQAIDQSKPDRRS